MKIVVTILVGGFEREIDVPCGTGGKTFKWLGNVCMQRYALSSPNGKLRISEIERGRTSNAQNLPMDIKLPNGESPHPAALLTDYLKDGDNIVIELRDTLNVTNIGSPTQSDWSTVAFSTASYDGLDVSNSMKSLNHSESKSSIQGSPLPAFSLTGGDYSDSLVDREMKANADFMRIIMGSQMLNIYKIDQEVDTHWGYISTVMPKLSSAVCDQLKFLMAIRWCTITELFLKYSTNGSMSVKEFTSLVEEADIFSVRDFTVLTARTFRRVANGNSTLSIGGFMASIVFLSQARHIDIYEKVKGHLLGPAEAAKLIIENNFVSLAKRLKLLCVIKDAISSDNILYEIRKYHDDLFLVFEKYAAKLVRDVSLTLPIELMDQLLFDAKLSPALDISGTQLFFEASRKGLIAGRSITANATDLPPPPENELTFAEFVEVCIRVTYQYKVDEGNINSFNDEIIASLQKVVNLLKPPVPSHPHRK